jgi:hypothetical protein
MLILTTFDLKIQVYCNKKALTTLSITQIQLNQQHLTLDFKTTHLSR